MKVYVVTQGEYSDYSIVAIFSDKKQAELKAALIGDGYCSAVSEWEVDEERLQGEVIRYYHIVYSAISGKIVDIWDAKSGVRGVTPLESVIVDFNKTSWAGCDIVADSEEQARKIFQDKFARAKYDYLMHEIKDLAHQINKAEES